MADSKISALPAATSATGTDELAVNQGGTTKKVTVAQVAATVPTTPIGGSDKSVQYNNAGALGGIAPGAVGTVLTSAGPSATPAFAAAPGGSPGGATKDIQFNNAGAFGGITPGVAGTVLTSGGAGVTPSFAAPTGGSGGGGGAAGALVLLEVRDAAASPTLDFTTRNALGQTGASFQSDYDEYVFELVNIQPATNAQDLRVQMGTGVTPTWDTSNVYQWAGAQWNDAGGAGASIGAGSVGFIKIGDSLSNAATNSYCSFQRLFNPQSATAYKILQGLISQNNSVGNFNIGPFGGRYGSVTPVTGTRFFVASGNIASGSIRLYGVAKTGSVASGGSGSAASSGWELLHTTTAAAQATVDLATRNVSGKTGAIFQSDYDDYRVEFINAIAAAGTPNLVALFSTDGGSTFLTTGYAGSLIWHASTNASGVQSGDTTHIRLNENYSALTAAAGGVSGSLSLFNPLSATAGKVVRFLSSNINGSDSNLYHSEGGGWNNTATPVNALRLRFRETGGTDRDTTSGIFRVYGLAKTVTAGSGSSGTGGGGALVFLDEKVAAASPTLDFTTGITSVYDDYEFRLMGVLPTTNGVNLLMQVSTDGGATWLAGTSYSYNESYITNASSGGVSECSTGAASYFLCGPMDSAPTTAIGVGVVELLNLPSTTRRKGAFSKIEYLQTGNYIIKWGGGALLTTAAVNAVRFLMSSGTIAEGAIRLYAKAKTASSGGSGSSAAGAVVQVQNSQTGLLASGTTAIPIDNSIPQITEGDQDLTVSITPTSATNKLKIDVVAIGANDAGAWVTAALFQDTTANALAASTFYQPSNGGSANNTFTHYMPAGVAGVATTFKVRVGSSTGTRFTLNGGTGAGFLGGAMASSITVTEINPAGVGVQTLRPIVCAIDGGGSALTTGIKADVYVPYACTVTGVTLLADQVGSVVVDIWKDSYANYPPTLADTITASAKPTLSSAIKSQLTTLTGWTLTLAAGDSLRFNIDSVATITRLAITLTVSG